MVAEQRETVQRIDADTHDIVANVEGGQRELLKVLARVSNSRWLMLKIFGVLIVFVSLSYKLSFSILTISAGSSWFLFSFRDGRPRWD